MQIIINQNAGTVLQLGEQKIKEIITRNTLSVQDIYFYEPDAFFERLENLEGADQPLLIGGGDGTIRGAAGVLNKNNISFGIIPLGTMNLLARDLNIPVDLHNCIEAYANGHIEAAIDLGVINDHIFLCCAALGTMPEASEVREKMRANDDEFIIPQLTAFVLSQIDRRNRKQLNLTMDNIVRSVKTSALVVSNNQYVPQQGWDDNNFRRASLQDGLLGIYSAAPYSWWDKVRMLSRLQLGNWRDDPAITEWLSETLAINTLNQTELVSLDGEPQEMETPLHFSIRPKALSLIVPKTSIPTAKVA